MTASMAPPFLNQFMSEDTPPKATFIPRRKHQKSRRGCSTCKRRHIRCDEGFPRCQNCITHRSSCSYPDAHYEATSIIKPSDSPDQRVKMEEPEDANLETSLIRPYAGVTETTWPTSRSHDSQIRTVDPSLWNLNFNPAPVAPVTARDRDLFTFCKSPMQRPEKHPSFLTRLPRHCHHKLMGHHYR